MSVASVMVDILIEKGFTVSEIARLANIDRSVISHVSHGNKRYSGKKIVKRLTALLVQTGYTKEQYDRIQDAVYHRDIKQDSIGEKPDNTETPNKPAYEVPTCANCKNIGILYHINIKGKEGTAYKVCEGCLNILKQREMLKRTL